MKSACYRQEWCERCEGKGELRVSPGDFAKGHPWVERWMIYRVSLSALIQDPEGRCVGCRSVRCNQLQVLALFLDRLGIIPDIKFHVDRYGRPILHVR